MPVSTKIYHALVSLSLSTAHFLAGQESVRNLLGFIPFQKRELWVEKREKKRMTLRKGFGSFEATEFSPREVEGNDEDSLPESPLVGVRCAG